MTESQLLTIALANFPTAVVVLVGILINNSRMSDLRTGMNERLSDLRDTLRAEMAKNQSEILAKFSEMDRRIEKLEAARWKP